MEPDVCRQGPTSARDRYKIAAVYAAQRTQYRQAALQLSDCARLAGQDTADICSTQQFRVLSELLTWRSSNVRGPDPGQTLIVEKDIAGVSACT
jgi:hypothetical protein